MPETDPRQEAMDELLRRSMSAPVPRLSADFAPRLARAVRNRARSTHPFGRRLVGAYGGVSVLVSVVVMRGQGLGLAVIAGTLIGATVLLAGISLLTREPLKAEVR